MGTGGGPPWFTPDYPSLAAKRDPFPDVERWQSTYVRYSLSDEAQPEGWDAESCRRNLHNVGRELGQTSLPESVTMRIVEAPAEFALPVKQDRRLLPCFKVRLEVKHRSAMSMPVTLRAHVLTQQDKEAIATWTPPDDGSTDGQKAVTELKGTAVIRSVFEGGDTSRSGISVGEIRRGAAASKDGMGFLPNGPSGSGSSALRSGERPIKVEPSFSFGTAASGPRGGGFQGIGFQGSNGPGQGGGAANGGGSIGAQRGFGVGAGMSAPLNEQAQQLLDSYSLVDSPGLSSNGAIRDFGGGMLRDMPGAAAPHRDISFNTLFASNRPDPVVTLASSGRLSGTGSSLPSFGSSSGNGTGVSPASMPQPPGLLGSGLRMGTGDSFDAAVEMLMQPSHQQQRRPSPLSGGALDPGASGSAVLGDMQRGPLLGGMPRPQLQQPDQTQRQYAPAERGPAAPQVGGSSGPGDSGKIITTTQDFEFTNLEFLKPTRMNKVYMAFTASILDTDMLFVVFNVPTIGICRAEQREKACKKLNIDYKLLLHFDQSAERSTIPMAAMRTRGLSGSGAVDPGAATSGGLLMPQRTDSSKLTQSQTNHRAGQTPDMKLSQLQGGGPSPLLSSRLDQLLGPKAPQQHSDVEFPRLAAGMADTTMQGAGMLGGGGGMVHGCGMLPGSMGMNGLSSAGMNGSGMPGAGMAGGLSNGMGCDLNSSGLDFYFGNGDGIPNGGMAAVNGMGGVGGQNGMEFGMNSMLGNSRKRDQGQKEDDNYRFQPVQAMEMPPYQGFMGLTSSDVEMLLPAPHSRMAMRDFIHEVYDSTGLIRKLTHMDMQALLSQAGFPMDSNREHDTISPQQWDEFCAQFRNIVGTLQQVASVWNMEDPVVISGFDMDRVGTITALANEPAGTFVCRFSMSQPGCLVLTCKVGPIHPRADAMGLIHAIIKIDDLHERRVDTWIRDYAGATHLLDVYRQKRVDKRKVFATNYTRLRGLDEQSPFGLGPGFV